MSEETKLIDIPVQWILDYFWVPLIIWVGGVINKWRQDNKYRDVELANLRERTAILEYSQNNMEKRFDRLEGKIDFLSSSVNELVRSLPKRKDDDDD